MKIPKRIVLPDHFVISIVLLPAVKMEETCEDTDGCWISEERRIYLNRELPKKQLDYVFRHEVNHAVNDWMLYYDYLVNDWEV